MTQINPENADDPLAFHIGIQLQQLELKVALAESCTGGLASSRLTAIPGASSYFEGACLTYSNASKTKLLGVPKEDIDQLGAVSSEVASAMAKGVRLTLAVDIGLSITGIAGPGGGSASKEVGLVYIGYSDPSGQTVRRFVFPGTRKAIQAQAAESALSFLRDQLNRQIALKKTAQK